MSAPAAAAAARSRAASRNAAPPAHRRIGRRGICAACPLPASVDELVFAAAVGDDDLAARREILGEADEVALRFLDILEADRTHPGDLVAQELAGALRHIGE